MLTDIVFIYQDIYHLVHVRSNATARRLEAAFLTDRIGKLMLYEPPLHEPVGNNLAVANRVEALIKQGELEQAFIAFQTEIVKQSTAEAPAVVGSGIRCAPSSALVLPSELDILQAGPAAQHVVRDAEHVIRLVIR